MVSSTEVGSTITFGNVFLKHHLFDVLTVFVIKVVAPYALNFASLLKAGLNILEASKTSCRTQPYNRM